MTPAAVAPLLLMRSATDPTAAVHHAIDAVLAGATASEAQQALDEWVALQAAQVQQLFTGPARPDCCTGIERRHLDVPQTADVTDYLRAKGEL